MSVGFTHTDSPHLAELVRLERMAFAAKLRMARAAIGCSQTELALAVGMTQRSVHKLEQGDTEPRRATVHAIERFWRDHGLEFEDLADGGFRVVVRSALLDSSMPVSDRTGPAGVVPRDRALNYRS
ncbi:MAG: helix-turn-helix domain-containing protein [Rhodopseudomonas sp.]|nr:helix-turn-helix domain-containing protein [Rhodopseudomonas sp.]